MPDGQTIQVKTFSPLFALSPLTSDKAWRTESYDQCDITINKDKRNNEDWLLKPIFIPLMN